MVGTPLSYSLNELAKITLLNLFGKNLVVENYIGLSLAVTTPHCEARRAPTSGACGRRLDQPVRLESVKMLFGISRPTFLCSYQGHIVE